MIEILTQIGFEKIPVNGTNVVLRHGKLNIINTLPIEKRDNHYNDEHLNDIFKMLDEHNIITQEKFIQLFDSLKHNNERKSVFIEEPSATIHGL